MKNPYLIVKNEYGGSRTLPNCRTLARDLAPLIKGKLKDGPDDSNKENYSEITLRGGPSLHISPTMEQSTWSVQRRVTITAHIKISKKYQSEEYKMPYISVSVERDIENIAKDVRRLIHKAIILIQAMKEIQHETT